MLLDFELNFKCSSICQKNTNKKCCIYISMYYMLTKSFHEKSIFFVSCGKKKKLVLKISFS
jgi:hypothetical protein